MKCLWNNYDPDECIYHTGCGKAIQIIDGNVTRSDYKYCPHCGLEINEDPVIE